MFQENQKTSEDSKEIALLCSDKMHLLILLWRWKASLIVNVLIVVMGAVVVMVTSMVFVVMELSLIVTVTDVGTIGAGALAAIGLDDWLGWGSAILWVINLSAQTIHTHTLLRCHFVGAHLKRDGGVIEWL